MISESERQEILGRIKIWKTIAIGGKTKEELLAELAAAGFNIGDSAREMMVSTSFVTEPESRRIAVSLVSPKELGFQNKARMVTILDRAKGLGLVLCPPSVGPHLRLAYNDQPGADLVLVAMEPIADHGYYPNMFTILHDTAGRWIGSSSGYSGDWCYPQFQIAFILPRKVE